ncbi:MAG: hypothetical protein R3C02_26795, partial [Planctomycetaceae bacterium]
RRHRHRISSRLNMRLPCIAGRMNYLGKNGSAASKDAYDHVILQWRRDRDVTGKHSLTVSQL